MRYEFFYCENERGGCADCPGRDGKYIDAEGGCVVATPASTADAELGAAVRAALGDWDAPTIREKADILVRTHQQCESGIVPRTLRAIADALEAEVKEGGDATEH